MERWFPEISQELLTSPLSKCQSPARSDDANTHHLASTCWVCDIVSYHLWIKALHSTSWKTLPVTAYAPKKCHTHPKATDVGFSEAKSQGWFFFFLNILLVQGNLLFGILASRKVYCKFWRWQVWNGAGTEWTGDVQWRWDSRLGEVSGQVGTTWLYFRGKTLSRSQRYESTVLPLWIATF